MKLNLGCCDDLLPGYVNVDIVPPCDQQVDLARFWPWQDSSVDEIRAHDIVEHLPNKIHTMNEIYRVLKPGGKAFVVVPSAAEGAGAFQDCGHMSYWTGNDFEYYEKGNYARERFRGKNGVTADFKILSLEKSRYQGKYDLVVKIHVVLEVIK